ncbi:hypothetical protein FRC00_001108 [Tulasnella sp. 408]|nr:hypothetical protein FRC00_001108 [Tulasnella sp. 408]
MTDQEVWEMGDEDILGSLSRSSPDIFPSGSLLSTLSLAAHHKQWQSGLYSHFNVSLKRETPDDAPSGPGVIRFVFTCKYGNLDHRDQYRNRVGDGSTGNLTRRSQACDQQRANQPQSPSKQPTKAATSNPAYDKHRHCAIIALRCARHHRPFNMVNDEEYKMEVALLNPKASIPSAKTVSRDTQNLWTFTSAHVSAYFSVSLSYGTLMGRSGEQPLIYLGEFASVVLGTIADLELSIASLKSSHTGQNLARQLYNVLKSFGLLRFLFSVVLVNASDCDALVKALHRLHPDFPGMLRRIRCWAHVINLIAKAFLALFFLSIGIVAKKVSVVQPARVGSKRKPTTPSSASEEASTSGPTPATAPALAPASTSVSSPEEDTLNNPLDADLRFFRHAEDAIRMNRPSTLTTNPEEERAIAGKIFPKVAGFARRVHDSSTLKEKFDAIVNQDIRDGKLEGSKTSLSRRVATRWNSDLHCLQDHIHFKRQVMQLIAQEPSLDNYTLSEQEWKLAEEVAEVLVIFEKPTLLFSNSEVPLKSFR